MKNNKGLINRFKLRSIKTILPVIFIIVTTSLFSVDYSSLYNHAISLAQDGDYETSLTMLTNIENDAILNEEYAQQLTVKTARGVVYRRMGEFNKSLNVYKDALILYKREAIDDKEKLAGLYQNYAVLNSTLGNDIASIEYYKKAIDVSEMNNNLTSIVSNKISLAKKNIDIGNVKNSINILLDINKFIDKDLPDYDKRHLLNNLVYAYLELGQFEEASKYLDKLSSIKNISNNYDVLIPCKINQAVIKHQEGDTEGALEIIDRTEKSCDNIFYKNILILAKAKYIASLANFDLAKKILKSAETYFKSISNAPYQLEIFNIRGQYPELLDINEVVYYNKMQDSIIKSNKATLLESIIINDELKEATKTIEAESKYKSIVITIGITIMLVLISSVLALNRQLKVRKMAEKNFDLIFSINDIYFAFDQHFANSLAKLQRYLLVSRKINRTELLEMCIEMTTNVFKLKEKKDEYISK